MKALFICFAIIFASSISSANEARYECRAKNGSSFTVMSETVRLTGDGESYDFPIIKLEKLEKKDAELLKRAADEKAKQRQMTSFESIWMAFDSSYKGLILVNLPSLKKSAFFGPDRIEADLSCIQLL